MPRRAIVLSKQQENVIDALVGSGRFASAEEVVGEGLRLVASWQPNETDRMEALRAAIQVGIDDIEHGRFVEFDNDEDLRAHLDDLVRDILSDQEPE